MATHSQEIEQIISSTSSFYSDNTYNLDTLRLIYKAYFDLLDMFKSEVEESSSNALLSHTSGYRTIPMQTINAWKGLYDINKAAGRFTADGYGSWYNEGDPNLLKNKVAFLTKYGVYETIPTRRDWEVTDASIASLNIVSGFGQGAYNYFNFSDYVVVGNKLYLFGDLAKPSPATYGKKILLKNIKIALNSLKNPLINQVSGIQGSPYLTVGENANLTQSLIRAIAGGPTIANINSALAILYSGGNLQVIDQYSASAKDKGMWLGTASATPILNPFDFMIKIPQSYSLFTDTLDLIKNYIDTVKPSYTNYMIIWSQGNVDTLNYSDTATTLRLTRPTITDIITFSTPLLFDSGVLFDSGIVADISVDGVQLILTTSPEMPVTVLLAKGLGNVITCTFNDTNADYYEIRRDDVVSYTVNSGGPTSFGPIRVGSSAAICGSALICGMASMLGVQDNLDGTLAPGVHAYRIKAWQGGKSTPWTLSYSITV